MRTPFFRRLKDSLFPTSLHDMELLVCPLSDPSSNPSSWIAYDVCPIENTKTNLEHLSCFQLQSHMCTSRTGYSHSLPLHLHSLARTCCICMSWLIPPFYDPSSKVVSVSVQFLCSHHPSAENSRTIRLLRRVPTQTHALRTGGSMSPVAANTTITTHGV